MNLLDQVKSLGEKLDDQTEDKGGFVFETPAAGKCPARFVGYIEVGKHPQRAFQGAEKPPAREVILEFELLGRKHEKEIEENGEKRMVYPVLREFVTIKTGDKAGFVKLLKTMAYGRDVTHMAMMLGEAFILEIIHVEVEKDGQKRTYANIKADGAWKIGAPMGTNEDGEDIPIKVPAATAPVKLLLWDHATKEQWDSIFIDGSRTDDKGNTISKNWIQDMCRKALDFEGSAVQQLVGGAADLPSLEASDMPEMPEDDTPPVGEPVEEKPAKTQAAVDQLKADATAAAEASPKATTNPLDDLGL